MTKIAYLECKTGIAGDMCLGALVAAGVPIEYLSSQLDRLGISSEYRIWAEQVHHHGQVATKVHVDLTAISSSATSHLATEVHSHEHSHTSGEHSHASQGHSHTSGKHTHASHAHTSHTSGEHSQSASKVATDLASHHHSHSHSHDHHHHHHHHYDTPQRNLPQIEKLITGANLPARATQWSLDIFRKLAIAEGAVHGIDPAEVHFHEVGAVDAIVDIVGTCLGLDYLDIAKIYCSPLPTGGGTVRAAHGILPVPVPAVLNLLASRQVPIYSNQIDRELVTPTGAAIAVSLATEFGAAPAMQVQQIGLGAGTISLPLPNILRLWVGTASEMLAASPVRQEYLEQIEVLTTQIDDLNPQAIGYIFDRLFAAGAVDVFTQPIGMKKSRSGILLTAICPLECSIDCEQIIFTETSTLGIRRERQTRSILPRKIESVMTKYGAVRVKVARNNLIDDDKIVNVQPEYEDCAEIARSEQVPWREVHQLALMDWHNLDRIERHRS